MEQALAKATDCEKFQLTKTKKRNSRNQIGNRNLILTKGINMKIIGKCQLDNFAELTKICKKNNLYVDAVIIMENAYDYMSMLNEKTARIRINNTNKFIEIYR